MNHRNRKSNDVDKKTKVDTENPAPTGDIRYIAVETLNDYFYNIFIKEC